MKRFLHSLGVFLALLILLAVTPLVVLASPGRQGQPSTLAAIRSRGYLIVGVKFDAPPFGFADENGAVNGFEIDLMREFAERWLGDRTAVEFVQVTSSSRIDRLLNGDIDLIAATMTITPERDEKIDFSRVYFLDGQNILVNAALRPGNEADAVRIQALDNRTIAAVKGSTSIERIEAFAGRNGITMTVAGFEQYDQAIRPLLEGRIDGLTTDRGILQGLAQEHAELAILLEQNFSEEPYGLGIRSGEDELIALINDTLLAMKADGAYDRIYRDWFDDQTPFALDTYSATGAAQPTATPTQSVTSAAATPTTAPPTATAMAVPTVAPTPTTPPTITPTAVVDLLPSSGAALRSFDRAPVVILLIALLFINAVYQKQR